MKKILTLVLFVISASAFAQKIWLTPFAGYTFDDRINTYSGYSGKIKGGAHYGASLEFKAHELASIELLYQGQSTTAVSDNYYPHPNKDIDLALQYIMLGILHHRQLGGDKVDGFGGLELGVALANDNTHNQSYTKFGLGFKAGLGIKFNPRIALILQAQLLSIVQGGGLGIYAGTGGVGAGASTYSSITQFGFTGGLSFALGK